MMLNNAVELPLSLPAVNKKTNEDEVASRAKSKSLITKASTGIYAYMEFLRDRSSEF